MSTTKNITMKQYNGVDYDTLYPKTIANQVDGVYNQQQTISNSTKTLFGLNQSSTPNDVFAKLGLLYIYWWKRSNINTSYSYVNDPNSLTINSGNNVTVYTSKTISTDINKNISLTNPISFNIPGYGSSSDRDLVPVLNSIAAQAPCYLKVGNNVRYLPVNSNVGGENGNGTISYIVRSGNYSTFVGGSKATVPAQLVVVNVTFTNPTYIQSANKNQYPHDGVSGNYYYQFLNIPVYNAAEASSIAYGTYIGTGVFGQSNKNMLTFDFTPRIIMISSDYVNASTAIIIWGNNHAMPYFGASFADWLITYNNNTVYWYVNSATNTNGSSSNVDAVSQMNYSDRKYYYVAIG